MPLAPYRYKVYNDEMKAQLRREQKGYCWNISFR